MAATDVEFERSSGTAEQLPKGAASDLNAALPTKQPSAPEVQVAVPQMANPADYVPSYQAEDDDMAFVTGPTTRPDEPVTTGIFPGRSEPLSPSVAKALPQMSMMAARPDASPEFRAMVAYLVREAQAGGG